MNRQDALRLQFQQQGMLGPALHAPGSEHVDERNLPGEIMPGEAESAAFHGRQRKLRHRLADQRGGNDARIAIERPIERDRQRRKDYDVLSVSWFEESSVSILSAVPIHDSSIRTKRVCGNITLFHPRLPGTAAADRKRYQPASSTCGIAVRYGRKPSDEMAIIVVRFGQWPNCNGPKNSLGRCPISPTKCSISDKILLVP